MNPNGCAFAIEMNTKKKYKKLIKKEKKNYKNLLILNKQLNRMEYSLNFLSIIF